MNTYILLLKSGQFQDYSPEEAQRIVERYMAWAEKLRKEDRHLGGHELKGSGRVLRVEKNQILDGPFTETKESVGGYFLIQARDYEEAVEISRGCPHLDYQGEIEIREINPH